MTRWIALTLLALLTCVSLAAPAAAQQPEAPAAPPPEAPAAAQPAQPKEPSDLLLRAGAPAEIASGQRVGTLVALGTDAIVAGTVTQDLVVLGGNATVSGEVLGTVTVVGGRLDLGPGARVGRDVMLVQSELTLQPGATVAGQVSRSSGVAWGWGAGWFFWLSTSVFVIACGLIFAAVGGAQLAGAASLLHKRPGPSVLSALIVWVGLPALAVLAFVTVVGIPIGLAVMFFALPVLWFLGYLVAGAELGALIGRWRGAMGRMDHPYAAVAVGLLVLQLVAFIPWLGALIGLLAGLWGAGALALRSLRVLRAKPPQAAATA
jgi:hypothetical protein